MDIYRISALGTTLLTTVLIASVSTVSGCGTGDVSTDTVTHVDSTVADIIRDTTQDIGQDSTGDSGPPDMIQDTIPDTGDIATDGNELSDTEGSDEGIDIDKVPSLNLHYASSLSCLLSEKRGLGNGGSWAHTFISLALCIYHNDFARILRTTP